MHKLIGFNKVEVIDLWLSFQMIGQKNSFSFLIGPICSTSTFPELGNGHVSLQDVFLQRLSKFTSTLYIYRMIILRSSDFNSSSSTFYLH